MKLFQKLLFENSNNPEKTEIINDVAGRALYQTGLMCDYAIKTSDVKENGMLHIELVEGQDIEDHEVEMEMQEVFDEIFSDLINEEPEMYS